MNQERRPALRQLDPRVRDALDELKGLIAEKYPTVRFEEGHGHDEPGNVHLTAIVDIDDTDAVLDLVLDRVVQLQVDERIPVHVIPIRTPERVLAAMESEPRPTKPRRRPLVSVLGDRRPVGR